MTSFTPVVGIALLSGTEVRVAAWALGSAHLAVIAVVATRIGRGPLVAATIFVLGAFMIPTLVPHLRPLLDAAPHFDTAAFPRSSPVLAPILTLAVIALALPDCSATASARGVPT